MAAPTALTVSFDQDEYSKFEVADGRATITVTVVASGGGDMSGEEITLELRKARRSRDAIPYTTTLTVSGSTDPQTLEHQIDLNSVTDSDELNLVRRGLYFLRATSVTTPAVTTDSSDFPISIVTAQQLRKTWLFGLNLEASDVRNVKFQPTNITGVEVWEVNSTHEIGFEVLTYIYTDNVGAGGNLVIQLSWGAGPAVSITAPGRYLLKRDCASDYIVVQIRSMSALPTANAQDELLVTKDFMTDDLLRKFNEKAADWWENDKVAGVFLEPTRLITKPNLALVNVPDWDLIVPAITFYAVQPAKWIDILFPYPGLLRIDSLFGQIADTRIVDIALEWAEISERNGFVQLVPFNQEVAFQFIGLVWVESLRGTVELPNFWNFDCMAGLRTVDPVIREMLGKKAAIDALTIAGHAFRGGFSSQSLSRDGVSESVSYTASAIYGIYSATIEDYRKFINKEIKQLKGRYRGVNMLVA
jgi:hypothetical protein